MNEQELNKKLAEWRWPNAQVYIPRAGGEIRVRISGQTTQYDLLTQSLDACFKWLVPKAIDRIMTEQECSSDLAYAILFKKWLQELELDIPQHAPTLCLAIEKLIDKEAKI